MCHRFWWHIFFFANAQSQTKKAKEPLSQRTGTTADKKQRRHNTGLAKVAGLVLLKTVFRKFDHSCFVDSFVLQIANFF